MAGRRFGRPRRQNVGLVDRLPRWRHRGSAWHACWALGDGRSVPRGRLAHRQHKRPLLAWAVAVASEEVAMGTITKVLITSWVALWSAGCSEPPTGLLPRRKPTRQLLVRRPSRRPRGWMPSWHSRPMGLRPCDPMTRPTSSSRPSRRLPRTWPRPSRPEKRGCRARPIDSPTRPSGRSLRFGGRSTRCPAPGVRRNMPPSGRPISPPPRRLSSKPNVCARAASTPKRNRRSSVPRRL